MNENAPLETARDADDVTIRVSAGASSGVSFAIRELTRVSYGMKRATFVVELNGLDVDGDLFIPDNGRPPFVVPASVRCKFTGAWKRTVRFGPELATDLLVAVLATASREGTT